MHTLAHDGNFKLDNLTMRNPDGDVTLSDGECMFVSSERFEKYIEDAES